MRASSISCAALLVSALVACGAGKRGSGDELPSPAGAPAASPSGSSAPPTTEPPRAGTPGTGAPRAVKLARATAIPACTVYVDGANAGAADGSVANPYKTLTAAIASAEGGAILCVAEGTYAEALTPGTKYFTLAGGFQTKKDFKVRDSSIYVSKAQGTGANTFLRIVDPAPTAGQLTAIDGFEITGYAQGIVHDVYYSQRLDITNDFIHDNVCAPGNNGGGFYLNNVSGTIRGNVIARNTCGRGGGGAIDDSANENAVTLESNLVDANVGNEPDIGHGGGLYLLCKSLTLTANELTRNSVTGWGAGLYIGADTGRGRDTSATLTWNVYRDNRAAIYGGGLFCDDSAHCTSDHEIYDQNCGGNVYLDCGPTGAGPTVATFDHLTNVRALTVDCSGPGPGVQITKNNTAKDVYTFKSSIFWGNAKGLDFEASCGSGCADVSVAVSYSDVQSTYANIGGVGISFGAGNREGVDPLFVDPAARDYHLRSTHGHWAPAPAGYAVDAADSAALMAGDPAGASSDSPDRAGKRSEMGAYGNSVEASLVR